MALPTPVLPRYGERSLADVIGSLLAALGIPGFPNPLRIAPVRRAGLLLVDGLGSELLRAHAADAPCLAELAAGRTPLFAGFPASTAVSLTSLGTGRPPGEHGMVGYTFAAPRVGLVNALTWTSHGDGPPVDLRERLPPERAQPLDTLAEQAARAGGAVTVAAPSYQQHSGLTRAAFRGASFRPTRALGDLAAALLDTAPNGVCYAYHGDLDLLGHREGPGSLPWRLQLAQVDRLVASVLDRLPPDGLLAVTADHGMVEVPRPEQVDADSEPALQAGVRLIGGEVRARHVYARRGAAADVLAAWRETLGERAWVVSREEAIGTGWFGPRVSGSARTRIGDVVVALRGRAGVVRRSAEPFESALIGQHGSLTTEEQLVPLLLVRGDGADPYL